VPDLLMDSARLQDSRKRLDTIFPSMTAIPWPMLPIPQLLEGLKLFSEERRILPYFDGYRDFQDVMGASGQHDVTVRQAAAILKDAGRLALLEPDVEVSVVPLKTGLFRKADHLELPKAMEAAWMAMAPYQKGVRNVRLVWAKAPVVERVEFSTALGERQLAIPRELMLAWEFSEGSLVKVRPAP